MLSEKRPSLTVRLRAWLRALNARDRSQFEKLLPRLNETVFLVVFWISLLVAIPFVISIVPGMFPDDFGWDFLSEGQGINAEALRNIFFAVAGAVGSIFGLFQLHNSAKRTRLADETVQSQKEAERNERFIKASELLAHRDSSMQMAGVYALKRLAVEEELIYATTVTDVLAGYIREITNRPDYKRQIEIRDPNPEKKSAAESDSSSFSKRSLKKRYHPPSEPIQAAISSLSHIWTLARKSKRTFARSITIRLDGAFLPNLDASSLNMEQWDLAGANLNGAKLHSANLSGANLCGAFCQDSICGGADFRFALLADAIFINANLHQAKFGSVYANSAKFMFATLTGASLTKGDFIKANFAHAKLGRAQADHASFVWTDFTNARAISSNFSNATLSNCNMGLANLSHSKFFHAKMDGTNLSNADLTGVTGLSEFQLESSVWAPNKPPYFSENVSADDFDKSEYAEIGNYSQLSPQLFDKFGRYIGIIRMRNDLSEVGIEDF